MADVKKAFESDEIHGYDVLDRLEADSLDRSPRPAALQRTDSAYEQLWLGEDSFYLGE